MYIWNLLMKIWMVLKAPAKMASKSKKDSKDQESIQSSTTSVPGYLMGK